MQENALSLRDQRVENSAISTDNSEEFDILHDSDHDPFEAESEEDG